MSRYRVAIEVRGYATVWVSADTDEEALEAATGQEWDWDTFTVSDVEALAIEQEIPA